ncbi:MAG: thioredoxin family protein [Sedimentisphaerales bacterium]|nr:thioredoxin family protein [Sedimentisphaerales bacterium]
MNQTLKVVIVVVLIISIIAVINIKRNKSEQGAGANAETTAVVNEPAQPEPSVSEDVPQPIEPDSLANSEITASAEEPVQPEQLVTKKLPKLLDLGSDQCIPCKLMAPILEELKTEYTGKFKVEFMDVRIDPMLAKVYNIKLIPTQIFFDASGEELFRHEGFYSKEDILSKWKDLGVEF